MHFSALQRRLSVRRQDFRYRFRVGLIEQLESRQLLASDWQNPFVSRDVSGDGIVVPRDALIAINELNERTLVGALGELPSRGDHPNAPFYDTTGDGILVPLDVLVIINALNGDELGPTILASLSQDTAPHGVTNTDRITSDEKISGRVVDDLTGVKSLTAQFDNRASETVSVERDGTFRFDPGLLRDGSADGDHTLQLTAVDGTLNQSAVFSLAFTFDTVAPPAPSNFTVDEASDTGSSSSDGLTNDNTPTFRGEAPAGTIISLFANGQLSGMTTANSPWVLEANVLPDDHYDFFVQSHDAAGNEGETVGPLMLTIDTVAPPAPDFDLAASSDTDVPDDQLTRSARVMLAGATEGNVLVRMLGFGESVRSSGAGAFRIPNVLLEIGANTLSVEAIDQAGNVSQAQRDITRVDAAAGLNPVQRWGQAVLEAIRLDATPPPTATRGMAMLGIAMLDVVNAIDETPGFLVSIPAPEGLSTEAAISTAAFQVMNYLFPGQALTLQAEQTAILDEIPAGASKTDGQAFGTLIGDAVVALRDRDGWDRFIDFATGTAPGQWRATPPMFDAGLLPQWGQVTPFAVNDVQALAPDDIPSLASSQWSDAFNEVKSVGRATSSARTTEQTEIARFWADGPGTYTPPGHWNQIALQFAQKTGLSVGEFARLFAMLNVALGDAAIVSWSAKYGTEFWRPITAIQNADVDGNPQTVTDPNWQPLLISPPFPEYVSGHSTFSGAAAEILTNYFGDNQAFATESFGLPGVSRSFVSFDAAAAEAGQSRIYGGIHYQFSNQDGLAAGKAVAQEVLDVFSVREDTRAPKIVFLSPPVGSVVSVNPTVEGWAIDNLAGVAGVEVRVDNGGFTPVIVDTSGRFQFLPRLPLDGTADGGHVLRFRAEDQIGLQSEEFEMPFTLDTRLPSITLDAPRDGVAVVDGQRLIGRADGTGSPIVSLRYQINDGVSNPITFNRTTGAYSHRLDLSRLNAGSHTLRVSSRDAAGFETSTSIGFSLDQAIPLAVSAHTPFSGASDIGSTFRPQVFFTRPIDPATLDGTNFFATDTSGTVLRAKVVPAQDASFAWLFFASPMPGGSTITVHLDGDTIEAADGTKLDADGNGTAGGELVYRFTTVSLAPLDGTSLSGRVIDPGDDLKPMTFDDIRSGADGILHTADDEFLNPIQHARVYILGLEDQFVFTDENGFFSFAAVPGGNIKLAIDGRTATNSPAGTYWPEMVMDLQMEVGGANTVMGTMGTPAERADNIDRPEVYLPRLRSSILTTIQADQPTIISVDAAAAPDLTYDQRQYLTLEVQPGSVLGEDGLPLANPQVGVSAVPPELVREMLPPGLLQHTFDITIQAPDSSVFSAPAALTFPNVFQAPPGSQLNLLSFDHTTGRLVIDGTATVSADGKFVSTDPGMGITHPGWHGGTPTGSQLLGEEAPVEEGEQKPTVTAAGQSTLFTFDGQSTSITVTNTGSAGSHSRASITISLNGIDEFAPGLEETIQFDLFPGRSRTIVLQTKAITDADLDRMDKDGRAGEVYSGVVEITARADGMDIDVNEEDVEKFYYGRFISAYHELSRNDIPFEPTTAGVRRDKTIKLFGHDSADFGYDLTAGDDHFAASESNSDVNVSFAPTFDGAAADEAKIVSGDLDVTDPDGKFLGLISVEGQYRPTTRVFVNQDEVRVVLARLSERLIIDDEAIIDEPTEREEVANLVKARVEALLGPLGGAIQFVDEPGPNTISVNWGSSLEVNSTGDNSDENPGDGRCDSGENVFIDLLLRPECTLRAAIEESNALTGGKNRITFGIPDSDPNFDSLLAIYTIAPATELPVITNPVTVDATTQLGFETDPVIEIAGDQAGSESGITVNGLTVFAGDSTIKGLTINGFSGHGIVLEGVQAVRNHIQTNRVGTTPTGRVAVPNQGTGIVIRGGARENLIGTDGDGKSDATEGNVIAGNRLGGIAVLGIGTDANIIAGNSIGTDPAGKESLPNGLEGEIDTVVFPASATLTLEDALFTGNLRGATITFLSGPAAGESRRITDHVGTSIRVDSLDDNPFGYLGVNTTSGRSTNPVPGDKFVIDGFGVLIHNGSKNRVGGPVKGERNLIANNLEAGVAVTRSNSDDAVGQDNSIIANHIFANRGLGIDLGRDGFFPNDNVSFDAAGNVTGFDQDDGPNQLQNSPELARVAGDQVDGTLHSDLRGARFRLDFFSSPANPDGHPLTRLEGHEFIDSKVVRTDFSDGYVSFVAPGTVKATDSQWITATATLLDANDDGEFGQTSEFSPPARQLKRGVTVITHGYQIDGNGEALRFLAEEVLNRTGGRFLNYDEPKPEDPLFSVPPTFREQILGPEFIRETIVPPVATSDQETILLFDWGSESNNDSGGWGEHAGDALFAMLVGLELLDPSNPTNNPEYHFIAHSMGTAVTSEVTERMSLYGVPVQHVTLLDPHEFNQENLPVDGSAQLFTLGQPQFGTVGGFESMPGYGASVWRKVEFVDSYYETRGTNDGANAPDSFVPLGRPIPGAYNRWTDDGNELPIAANNPYKEPPGGKGGDHSYLHNVFYVGSVRGALPTVRINGENKPLPDLQRPENRETERDLAQTGYAFSRNALFDVPRPAATFFNSGDEPQDHVASSPVLVDAIAGSPNVAGLSALNQEIPFHGGTTSVGIDESLTNVRWVPVVNPLTIFNGNFETGRNLGSLAKFLNGREVPGWNFQGGGGISFLNLVKDENFNHSLGIAESGSASHNLMYIPPRAGLVLRFQLEPAASSAPGGLLEVTIGDHFLGSVPIPTTGDPVEHTLAVPAGARNRASSLVFDAVGSNALVDNIRFGIEGNGESESGSPVADPSSARNTVSSETASDSPSGPLGDSRPSMPYIDPAVGGDGVDDAGALANVVERAPGLIVGAARHYLLATALNQSLRSNVAVYVDAHLNGPEQLTRPQLANALATTAVHEIAHTLGTVHTGLVVGRDSNGDPIITGKLSGNVENDIMLAGLIDVEGRLSFQSGLSSELATIGLGSPWDSDDGQAALDALVEHVTQFGPSSFDSASHVGGSTDGGLSDQPIATLFDNVGNLALDGVDFARTTVGSTPSQTINLLNLGRRDLVVTAVDVVDSSGSFSVTEVPAGTVLPAGGLLRGGVELPITIQFAPLTKTGQFDAMLRIFSNDPRSPHLVPLHGFAASPTRDVRVDLTNNNAGGQTLGSGAKSVPAFATIRNIGEATLSISGIRTTDIGSGQFRIAGLPGSFGPGSPIVLAPDATFVFDLIFDPNEVGLQRGVIEILSDDPDQPNWTQSVVGTGLADSGSAYHRGNDYLAFEDPYANTTTSLRTQTDPGGNFELFVGAEQFYHVTMFDPVSGLVASVYDMSLPSGQTSRLGLPLFRASTAPDTDGDGLPDDAELAIGTSRTNVDTNGDGISDFAAIQQGLNPLAGKAFATGVVAAARLTGEAKGVAIEATGINLADRTAFVATGSHGLAILDVSEFDAPILLSELDLTGDSRDVAVDSRRAIAAVAGGAAGLHLVQVENPSAPVKLATTILGGEANLVETSNGIAYVAVGATLVSVDLASGEVLQTLVLGGDLLTGLAREGNLLFVQDRSQRLRAIDISQPTMQPRGVLTLSDGGGRLFVGDGIAYVTEPDTINGGFTTVDISDPDNLLLLGRSNGQAGIALPRTELVTNGSGLGLLIGDLTGVGLGHVFDVYDVTDPLVTTDLVTRFRLPAASSSLSVAGGFAFVADGTAGLQVVNFRAFDEAGQPPTVTITSPIDDADPGSPGFQVIEGSTILIRPTVSDDVQVQQVDLLINNEVVSSDLSFPYDLSAIALSGNMSVEIQARATDTGGNVGLSNKLVFELIPDNTPPRILSITPADGGTVGQGLRRIGVEFSEPLSQATIASANFQLKRVADGTVVPSQEVDVRFDDRTVQLLYSPLPSGEYVLELAGSSITDRAGNALAAGTITSDFTLVDFTVAWTGGSGFWDVAGNWSTGVVPGPTDVVLISVPGDVVVTHRFAGGSGITQVAGLIGRETLTLAGATLQVDGAAQVDQLNIGAGNFVANGETTVGGLTMTGGGKFETSDTVILTGESAVSNGLMRGVGQFTNQGTLTISGSQFQLGATFIFGDTATLNNAGTLIDMSTQWNISVNSLLNNRAGATYDLRADGRLGITDTTGAPRGTIENAGRFVKSEGTGTSEIRSRLNVNGVVDVLVGELAMLSGGQSTAGQYNVSADAKLRFGGGGLVGTAGPVVLGDGTQFAGEGSVFIQTSGGVDVTIPADATVSVDMGNNTFVIASGITTIDGSLINSGSARWDGGSIRGSGTFINAGTLELPGTIVNTELRGTLRNTGTILQRGTRPLRLVGSGKLENLGGIYEMQSVAGIFGSDFDMNTVKVVNSGTLRKTTDSGTATISVPFSNSGTVEILVGTLAMTRSLVQTDGKIALSGGNLSSTQLIDLRGGALEGAGVVTGNVTSSGTVRPGGTASAGTLTITGNYTQTAAGVLELDLGGTAANEFDLLRTNTASGNQSATLNGALTVSLIHGFRAAANDTFEVIEFDARTGDFATNNGLDLGGGLVLQKMFSATRLSLDAMQALRAAGAISPAETRPSSVEYQLDAVTARAVFAAALERLNSTLTTAEFSLLAGVVIEIADLAGDTLGVAGRGRILLDASAAGFGWFIDSTPDDDSEFTGGDDSGVLHAETGSPAAGRMDLLTVLAHELQHLLGREHEDDPDDLMFGQLEAGSRHRFDRRDVDEVFGRGDW